MMTSLSLVNMPCTITAPTPLFPRPQSSRLRAEGHCLQNGSTFCELFTSAQPSQVGQARGGTLSSTRTRSVSLQTCWSFRVARGPLPGAAFPPHPRGLPSCVPRLQSLSHPCTWITEHPRLDNTVRTWQRNFPEQLLNEPPTLPEATRRPLAQLLFISVEQTSLMT